MYGPTGSTFPGGLFSLRNSYAKGIATSGIKMRRPGNDVTMKMPAGEFNLLLPVSALNIKTPNKYVVLKISTAEMELMYD